ncbi:response regulator [Herminiimonas glaciei]|uniref:Response regulator n=1 Tax=Herminiimonas glaciei TaxID=523788 RepID=A0ABW2IA37_9BURK
MNRTHATPSPLVLVVEDEPELSDILVAYLQRDNLRTILAANGPDALRQFREHQPAIVLLDIRLPGKDGVDVLKEIRQESDTPVIMTTALADDLDKMLSLRLGADDYVVKPYNPAEVIERVRAVLRRTLRTQQTRQEAPLRIGQIEIDAQGYTARAYDAQENPIALPLTLTEFRILACLAKRPRRCFSRAELIEACLPESDALDRVIDSHLSKLRRKLQDAGCDDLIETVRGIGYRLWRDS